MGLTHAGFLLLFFYSAYSVQLRSARGYGLFVQDPELEWMRMELVKEDDPQPVSVPKSKFWRSGSPTADAKTFPEYVQLPSAKYPKEVFKPEKKIRPLPDWAKEILLVPPVTPVPATATPNRKGLIEILCHVDRLYVRISRQVFKSRDAYKYLKLGTCPVNQGTKDHYYLLYLLKTDCAFKKVNTAAYLTISNVLHYKPTGPIVREIPFDVPLECKFPKLFNSYKVGIHPKLQGGTVYKALQPQQSYSINPQDASGNEITGSKTYTLGQPMFFEAKKADKTTKSVDQRMYINKCFMTSQQNPNSSPKYTVIENQGCMVDSSMTEQSKFHSGSSKTVQKFSVGAFIFKDKISTSSSTQQLYMHCEISMGKLAPTQTSKACNYNPKTKKWVELYGDDSVCTCCESTCPSPQPKASSNTVSSRSWKVDMSGMDGYVDAEPRIKSLDADSFGQEDLDDEQQDFLNYWEQDY